MAKKKTESLVQHVGRRLREIRLERGLTQAAVAEAAGCDPQTIQRAESGKYGLSLNRLESVAKGLGVGITALFEALGTDVPAAPWTEGEAAVVAAWRRIPEERRDLAARLLREFAR